MNLVFSSVGVNSAHRRFWMRQAAEKEFDLFLVNFSADKISYAGEADYYVERKGYKFQNLTHCLHHHREVFSKYDYIYMPDDDVRIDTRGINKFFRILAEKKPLIAAPVFKFFAYSPHPTTKRIFFAKSHTAPIPEINNVAFSREAFFKCEKLFARLTSAWGAEFILHRYIDIKKHPTLFVDSVVADHPMRVSELDRNFGSSTKDAGLSLMAEYGIEVDWGLYRSTFTVNFGAGDRDVKNHKLIALFVRLHRAIYRHYFDFMKLRLLPILAYCQNRKSR